MTIRDFLFVFDFAAMGLIILIAYLSRRLGEALKIPPYYRVLFGAAAAIFCAFILDTILINKNLPLPAYAAMLMRCAAGIAALAAALRYWHWLFAEYFKK